MNKNLSQSSQDKSNNYSPSQFTNAVKPKHYGLTYKERHSPSRRKSGHNGVPQNPRVSHINAEGNRKTFSPSAPNRPRGSHGGNSNSGRSRQHWQKEKQQTSAVRLRDHERIATMCNKNHMKTRIYGFNQSTTFLMSQSCRSHQKS